MEVRENTSREDRRRTHCNTGGLESWNPAAPGWSSSTEERGVEEGEKEEEGRREGGRRREGGGGREEGEVGGREEEGGRGKEGGEGREEEGGRRREREMRREEGRWDEEITEEEGREEEEKKDGGKRFWLFYSVHISWKIQQMAPCTEHEHELCHSQTYQEQFP